LEKVFIQNYNWGPELEVIRTHELLIAINNYVNENCAENVDPRFNILTDKNNNSLDDLQKFYAILAFSRGELLENCKSRNYISYKASTIFNNDRLTIQSLKHEYRSYLSECVVLYDRLAYFISFLELCYKSNGISFESETVMLHTFFNPLLFDIRNENAHHRYVVRTEYLEVEYLENLIHDMNYNGDTSQNTIEQYVEKLGRLIEKDLDWFEFTSKEFAGFFISFLNCISTKILNNGLLQEPKELPSDLVLNKKITPNFRRKIHHKKLFNESNDTDY